MRHYKISSGVKKKNCLNNYPFINVVNIYIEDHQIKHNLPKDDIYLQQQCGFKNSDYDCECFSAHISAWEHFLDSGDDYCLITQENTEWKNVSQDIISEMESELSNMDNWDLFYPYDPTFERDIQPFNYEYILGYRWGLDAYFLSKKGATKLLSNIVSVKQPLDEEFIDLMTKKTIKLLYCETQLFNIKPDYQHLYNREKELRNAISRLNVWSIDDKKLIQELLQTVSQISKESNIEIILSDGSLLGFVRHGKIMSWDDDVDLAINFKDLSKFISYLESENKIEFVETLWDGHKYLKIWFKGGKEISNYPHKFPFIDVWYFNEIDSKVIFNYGLTFPVEIYKPFKRVKFENQLFMIPLNPQACLTIEYPNWNNEIKIVGYSHQMERMRELPFRIKIDVDINGRILDKSLE